MTKTYLTDLANYYNSDKGDQYKCAHHYTRHYEAIFEQFKKKRGFALLEIGLNRDDTSDVPSLRMYRDFFGDKAKIYGMDIRPEFSAFNEEGFSIFIGDQSNAEDLFELARNSFNIIIDDGSHASSHQQISLRELWKAVKPGGYYIIEDLHWQPFSEPCIPTRKLCEQWLDGQPGSTEYIAPEWSKQFLSECQSLALLPSFSKLHSADLTEKALFIAQKK